MSAMDEIDDTSRTDAYAASRRRIGLLHASWRPMLAGALASLAVSAAIWAVLPRFEVREVVVDRVVQHDVSVDHVIPRDVPIDIPIPRIAPAAPETSSTAPRTPTERRFEAGKDWQDPSVVVRGRILRQDGRGFVLATDEGEQSFYPARIGPDGRPMANLAVKSFITPFLGDLCFCSRLPAGTFHCVALHAGVETEIRQVPIAGPTSGKPAFASSSILIRLESIEARR
jgi:hypothetical protein